MTDNRKREEKFHLYGWILFLVCAVLFIIASLESGSRASLAGSVIFIIACIVFLYPLLIKK
ncbi:cytochrome oxidase subunit III [Chloroflexota bacterium]